MSKATSAEVAIVGGLAQVRDVVSVILEDFSPSNPRGHLAIWQLLTTRLVSVRFEAEIVRARADLAGNNLLQFVGCVRTI